MKVENKGMAQIIGNFLPELNAHRKLPAYKLRALDALLKCRTPYMGGHIEACEGCGETRIAHNSCRNRHCPQCGAIDKEKWIMAREVDLLPVNYFHVVFTVPDKLNKLFLENQPQMYSLLFQTAWSVLKDFGDDPQWIGGQIGATGILHTCGQNLRFHPHVHFIVPAGALTPKGHWKHSRSLGKYLFNVQQLSNVFRARFVQQLRRMRSEKLIAGNIPHNLFEKDWVVYAKEPFGGPAQILNYLSRYTHRTAISNDRILRVDNQKVTFSWKDYRNNYAREETTLDGPEFLRLFCMHILPPGFTRIRHYGFLSSAAKGKALHRIRKALKAATPARKKDKPWQELVFERMGINPGVCKCCGSRMVIVEFIPNQYREKQRAPPGPKLQPNEKFSA
jgi:hypothetical protein